MDNQNFNNQNYNNYNQGQYNAPAPGEKSPKYTLWLVLGIVQIVAGFCCAGGIFTLVTGILTIVFANNANTAYQLGDMATHDSKIKSAMIMNIIGWVLAVIIFILICVLYFTMGLASAMNS